MKAMILKLLQKETNMSGEKENHQFEDRNPFRK
jgi:hypothetical protein